MWSLQSTALENFLVILIVIIFILKPHLQIYCIEIYLCILCVISVCDVLPLVIKNVDMRLPANLMQKYMLKAAEFYIGYVTRGPSSDAQIHGNTPTTFSFLHRQIVNIKKKKKLSNYFPASDSSIV